MGVYGGTATENFNILKSENYASRKPARCAK